MWSLSRGIARISNRLRRSVRRVVLRMTVKNENCEACPFTAGLHGDSGIPAGSAQFYAESPWESLNCGNERELASCGDQRWRPPAFENWGRNRWSLLFLPHNPLIIRENFGVRLPSPARPDTPPVTARRPEFSFTASGTLLGATCSSGAMSFLLIGARSRGWERFQNPQGADPRIMRTRGHEVRMTRHVTKDTPQGKTAEPGLNDQTRITNHGK